LQALRGALKTSNMMAYLVMMAPRLIELHRSLKTTGSIYLHCDPTASHYLKLLMDIIFNPKNFRNEIIWKRMSAHGNVSARYGDVTDVLLFYAKGDSPTWNPPYTPLDEKHIKAKYTHVEPDGRRFTTRDLHNHAVRPNLNYEYKGFKPHPNGWACTFEKMKRYDAEGRLWFPKNPEGRIRLKLYLDESKGRAVQNLWDDVSPINSMAKERLGYPTQKPESLLERILTTSSNEDDLILDPFCGCGTTINV
jgi:site-specific DNA-methyltransferase (adenine-specific)